MHILVDRGEFRDVACYPGPASQRYFVDVIYMYFYGHYTLKIENTHIKPK